MRRLLFSLVAASLSAFAFEGLPPLHQPVTVVVQAENPIDPKAFEKMQREMNRLLAQSVRRVEFIDRKQMQTGVDVADLTVVRFRGNCRMTVEPVYFDERESFSALNVRF